MTPSPAVRFCTSISVGSGVALLLCIASLAIHVSLDWLGARLGNDWAAIGFVAAALLLTISTLVWIAQGKEGSHT